MRGLAARLAGRAAQKLGWSEPAELLHALAGARAIAEPPRVVTHLTSLLPLLDGQQHQQRAAMATRHGPPGSEDDEDEAAARAGAHRRRVRSSELKARVVPAEVGAQLVAGEDGAAAEERQSRIKALLASGAGGTAGAAAGTFVESFFGSAAGAALDYKGEDFVYPAAVEAAAEAAEGGDGEALEPFEVETPAALDAAAETGLLAQLQGLGKGSQRVVLQKLLAGGMLRADPAAMREWQDIQRSFQPPENFRMKVVDVNRTCKGTRSGGLYRFSCMVVVGNGEGVLGWGQGKAVEVNEAVKKAYTRACRNLYPIPRYNGHTLPESMEAKFGQVKVTMYPKAAGNGIVANPLVRDICKMAGIHDAGVKVHGSRNPRNTVKCLFDAFDKLRTPEEILNTPGKLMVAVAPGRYGTPARAKAAAGRTLRQR